MTDQDQETVDAALFALGQEQAQRLALQERVSAALALHRRIANPYDDDNAVCARCRNNRGRPAAWPCETVQTLTGKATG